MDIGLDTATLQFLKSELSTGPDYFEWGAGGSTCLAAETTSGRVVSTENDIVWVNKVKSELSAKKRIMAKSVNFYEVDMGQIGKWGYPKSVPTLTQIEAYTRLPWNEFCGDVNLSAEEGRKVLVLIDGRYRKACLMNVLMSSIDAKIILDDAVNRDHLIKFADAIGGYKIIGRSFVWEKKPDFGLRFKEIDLQNISKDSR